MGLIAIEQGDYGRATIYYKKALQIYEDEQDFYNASDEYHGLGKVAKAQGNYNEALAYFQKALKVRCDKQDWYKVAATLVELGETLEAQQCWTEALKIYIKAFSIDIRHDQKWSIAQAWVGDDIQALRRMLKVLGVSQFETVWREVTGEECPEWVHSAIQAASEENEE